MKRNSKGQFISGGNDISIPLPSFIGLYKILIIAILVFPWYAILSNKNVSNTLFQYIIGRNFTDDKQCQTECQIPQVKEVTKKFNTIIEIIKKDPELKKILEEFIQKIKPTPKPTITNDLQ